MAKATDPAEANHYSIHLQYSEEDRAFIAWVPELAGCIADGPSPLEALCQIYKHIEIWRNTAKMLGHPIPEPMLYKGASWK